MNRDDYEAGRSAAARLLARRMSRIIEGLLTGCLTEEEAREMQLIAVGVYDASRRSLEEALSRG